MCSILTYGSEAWRLTPSVSAALNGANSNMVSIITGRHVREEASEGKTFDLIKWIRARKLQWLGHILRMGKGRKVILQRESVCVCRVAETERYRVRPCA